MKAMRAALLLLVGSARAALLRQTYKNSALAGPPVAITTLTNGGELSLSSVGGSTAVSGTLTYDASAFYAFNCSFSGGQIVFVWVGDHLVCHTDPPFGSRSPSGTDGSIVNPLRGVSGQSVPLLVHVYSASLNNSGVATSGPDAHVSIRWANFAAPLPRTATPAFAPLPDSALSSTTSAAELRRRALQDSLKHGWNTWSYNMLGIVRLPQSFSLTTAICQLSTQQCLEETHIEDTHASIRVGERSGDPPRTPTPTTYMEMEMEMEVGFVSLPVGPRACQASSRTIRAFGSSTSATARRPLSTCRSPSPAATALYTSSPSRSTAVWPTARTTRWWCCRAVPPDATPTLGTLPLPAPSPSRHPPKDCVLTLSERLPPDRCRRLLVPARLRGACAAARGCAALLGVRLRLVHDHPANTHPNRSPHPPRPPCHVALARVLQPWRRTGGLA
jgi:hypothetical protein